MTVVTSASQQLESAKDERVVEELNRLLADTHVTFEKTLFYHWNVSGPHFTSLHQLFEEQYHELLEAMDTIAERIRQLGSPTTPFGEPMSGLASIDDDGGVPFALDMVRYLSDAHLQTAETAMTVVALAEDRGDVATVDIVTERIVAHEKATWMLRSIAE